MQQETFEQVQADATGVGDAAKWIKGEESCVVTLWILSELIRRCRWRAPCTTAVSTTGRTGLFDEVLFFLWR